MSARLRSETSPIFPESNKKTGKGMKLLLTFIVIFLVFWFILYISHPVWVQNKVNGNPDGSINNLRCFLYSIIIAAIVTLIVWMIIK